MKKEKEPKVVYFKDELNDDFADNKISTKTLDNSYKYINNSLYVNKINSFNKRKICKKSRNE